MAYSLVYFFKGLKKFQFREILMASVFIFALQIVLIICKIPLSIVFLVPVIFFLYKKNINDKFLYREEYFIVYINLGFLLVVLLVNMLSKSNAVQLLNIAYLLYYTVRINWELRRQKESSKYSNSKNVISVLNYFSVLGVIFMMIMFFEKNFYKVFEFNASVIFIGIMFLCMVFSIIFLITFKKEITAEEQIEDEHQGRLLLEEYNLKHQKNYLESNHPLAKAIVSFYEKSTDYLNVDFNLVDLAQLLHCSKAEVSDVLNHDMKIGFYALTARYRIEHAKKLLLKKDNFTMEALMVQCGFQSKSTFNKYFNEFVGMKPSVFRKLHTTIKNQN